MSTSFDGVDAVVELVGADAPDATDLVATTSPICSTPTTGDRAVHRTPRHHDDDHHDHDHDDPRLTAINAGLQDFGRREEQPMAFKHEQLSGWLAEQALVETPVSYVVTSFGRCSSSTPARVTSSCVDGIDRREAFVESLGRRAVVQQRLQLDVLRAHRSTPDPGDPFRGSQPSRRTSCTRPGRRHHRALVRHDEAPATLPPLRGRLRRRHDPFRLRRPHGARPADEVERRCTSSKRSAIVPDASSRAEEGT